MAIKLNRAVNKNDRYESHSAFLKQCLNEEAIPHNFKFTVDPSIGNHDEFFLEGWHQIIKQCQIDLIKHTIKYTEKTIQEAATVIMQLDNSLKNNLSNQVYNKAKQIIYTTSTKTKTELSFRKRKKLNFIKYGKPNRQGFANTVETDNTHQRNLQGKNHAPSQTRAISNTGNQTPPTEYYNVSRDKRENELEQKDFLIQRLQQELKQKQMANSVSRQHRGSIDAKIKEKDQIIETLKFDLQQPTSSQQQFIPQQVQQPLYSAVINNHTVNRRSNQVNQQKKHQTAPEQIEGKKELINAEEMAFLNTGIRILEKQFQTVLNML